MGKKKTLSKISQAQLTLYKYIQSFSEQHGYGPTYREMQAACGYTHSYGVARDLRNLYNVGLIETDHPGSPRAVRPAK